MDTEVNLRTLNIGKRIQEQTNLYPGEISYNLKKPIQPILDVSTVPIIANVAATTTISTPTIYTTPDDKDFYLTAAWITYAYAAANNSLGLTSIQVIVDDGTDSGVTYNVVGFAMSSPTVATNTIQGTVSRDLKYPLKLKRSSAITVTSTANPDNDLEGIEGFIVDTNVYTTH